MTRSELQFQAGAGAFGDGSHPTTAGVLAALESLDPAQFTPESACDIGAGSGILSMAIARLFDCPVTAVELDRQAFETLQENIKANGLAKRIASVHADGFSHPTVQQAAPFDLIVMNILAEPLLSLAAAAEAVLAPEGVLIASGLMQWQEPQIREAYQSLDLEITARLTSKEWVTLSFQKP